MDLFCGAGGTSTGVERAVLNGKKCAKVIACVNHDANAIASHAANHPDALHFTEDIRTPELSSIACHVNLMRRLYPKARLVLWASLECTNFSRAKGGQPRDPDSRTLAEYLFRYIDALFPDYICIENVEEFMSWGDLDENGKPMSLSKGVSYNRWVDKVKGRDYEYDYRILNSADYGAYTVRKRFFGIFAKPYLPINFPEPTHAKKPKEISGRQLEPWRAVREMLDFTDTGMSIFSRKKPLAEATLERIYAGLVKFVAGGKGSFLIKWNSMNKGIRYNAPGIDAPCPTVATQNRLGVAFTAKDYSGNPFGKVIPVSGPAGTVTTADRQDRLAKVTPFIVNSYSGGGQLSDIDKPNPAVTTIPKQSLVFCEPDNCVMAIKPGDSPAMVKIKVFMRHYNLADIRMRMLKVSELKKIMGFPENYYLKGTQSEQKKFIGNAVEVRTAAVLCEALCAALDSLAEEAAA